MIDHQHDQTRQHITAAFNRLDSAARALVTAGMRVPDEAAQTIADLALALRQLDQPTTSPSASMTVKITPNDKGNPAGKLADAELHFGGDSPLDGLKLIGFSIWEHRTGGGRNVTFPARQYSINGERRSFALLRPIEDAIAQDRIRELILEAYRAHEDAAQDTNPQPGTHVASVLPDDLTPSKQTASMLESLAQLPPEQVNPGILLGTMSVEAIFGQKGVSPLPRTRRF